MDYCQIHWKKFCYHHHVTAITTPNIKIFGILLGPLLYDMTPWQHTVAGEKNGTLK